MIGEAFRSAPTWPVMLHLLQSKALLQQKQAQCRFSYSTPQHNSPEQSPSLKPETQPEIKE